MQILENQTAFPRADNWDNLWRNSLGPFKTFITWWQWSVTSQSSFRKCSCTPWNLLKDRTEIVLRITSVKVQNTMPAALSVRQKNQPLITTKVKSHFKCGIHISLSPSKACAAKWNPRIQASVLYNANKSTTSDNLFSLSQLIRRNLQLPPWLVGQAAN